MTYRDLIASSLRLAGIIATGETPTASEQSDAFDTLIQMVDAWNTDGLILFSRPIQDIIVSNSQEFIGPGYDGNPRPNNILNASVKSLTSNTSYPVDIITSQEWMEIPDKAQYSTFPKKIFIEKQALGIRINIWPIPSEPIFLTLNLINPITIEDDVDIEIILPPGYIRALRYNLALELAAEYGKNIDPRIDKIANDSIALISRNNFEPTLMSSDAVGLSSRKSFNIYTGE